MGLDMYLTGERVFRERHDNRPYRQSERFALAYWRKHPDLHGFIVQTFARGQDDCEEIGLDASDLQRIIDAVQRRQLPHTTGFFFGASDGSEQARDLILLTDALDWLTAEDPAASRSVIYRASW